jgi:Ca2+-binding RTX toxin-like protein
MMQGIFITDDDGNLPYSGVDIENNVVLGGNWTSIGVSHSSDATVVNNYVTALNMLNATTGTTQLSEISVNHVAAATMTGNHASAYLFGSLDDSYFSGNVVAAPIAKDQAIQSTADGYMAQIHGQNLAVAMPGGGQLLVGTDGADSLVGGSGDDTMIGGAGADTIVAGSGADHMVGGDGADVFVFNSISESTLSNPDTIADFTHAEADLVDLSGIDAKTGGSDDAFTIVKYFTKHAGELRIDFNTDHVEIRGDVNGDGIADFQINVNTTRVLTASDFIL